MQVIETGPRTIVVHAVVRTPNLAPNGPYPPAEMQVGRAVSRYLLARRCSDGELHLEPTDGWWNPRVKSTLLSVDGQQRPAETLVCTAVAAEFMVRMGSRNYSGASGSRMSGGQRSSPLVKRPTGWSSWTTTFCPAHPVTVPAWPCR